MTTSKLYTATDPDGEEGIFFETGTWWGDEMSYRNVVTQQGYKASELRNRQPVTVVPKDGGVWVEGFTVPYLADMADFAKAVMRGQGHHNSERDFKKLADQLTAQLAPSATTETEGGAGCRWSIDTPDGKIGVRCNEPRLKNNEWLCTFHEEMEKRGDFSAIPVPKPTPTVTIELTGISAEELLDAAKQSLLFTHLKQDNRPRIAVMRKIVEQLEPLTPPRIEEPKEYTQLVRANEKGFIQRPRWQKNIANDLWNSDDGDINVKWSDLENPVVLEGQVVIKGVTRKEFVSFVEIATYFATMSKEHLSGEFFDLKNKLLSARPSPKEESK